MKAKRNPPPGVGELLLELSDFTVFAASQQPG
jgi:hypothetical protein